MIRTSLLAMLMTASLVTPSLAQTTVDTNAGATVGVGVGDTSVSVGAEGSTSVGAGTDGNEAGGSAVGGTSGQPTNNQSKMESMSCEESGLAASIEAMGTVDTSMLSSATSVSIVGLSNCDDTTRSALASEGGTNVRQALQANPAIVSAIQSRGADMSDVIGATVDGDTVTVYVESEDISG
jgi:hypothetical protein